MDEQTTDPAPSMQNESSSTDDGVKINVITKDPAPVINDITPPPAPQTDSAESITVVSAPSDNEDALSAEEPEVKPEPPVEESLAPVAEPPKEEISDEIFAENEVNADDESAEAPKPEENNNEITPTVSSNNESEAPAVMGIAASEMNKQPHRNNKKFARIVTVVVALLLAGIAVYVYLSANKNTENSKTTSQSTSDTSTETADSTPATTDDIDTASNDVDKAINALDETADFTDDNLSDTTLNL